MNQRHALGQTVTGLAAIAYLEAMSLHVVLAMIVTRQTDLGHLFKLSNDSQPGLIDFSSAPACDGFYTLFLLANSRICLTDIRTSQSVLIALL